MAMYRKPLVSGLKIHDKMAPDTKRDLPLEFKQDYRDLAQTLEKILIQLVKDFMKIENVNRVSPPVFWEKKVCHEILNYLASHTL